MIGTVAATLVLAASASADVTLGSTAFASGSTARPCAGGSPVVIAQPTSDPATPYAVPAGGGQITQWQISTAGASAGTAITFLVVRPSGGSYTVVAVDTEALPTLPASGLATFTPASPIAVAAGDLLALYATPATAATCYTNGGTTPSVDSLIALGNGSIPAPGQSLSQSGPPSGSGYTLNLSATLVQVEDAAVTAAASPASVVEGNLAVLTATVANGGPVPGPITFTDAVPAGLTIDSAVAGSGACTVSGQTVTCTITGLAPGQSAPVDIVVSPTVAKPYTNTVAVSASQDPNPANNTASAQLMVNPVPVTPPPSKCTVPALARAAQSLATRVLVLLHCKPGPVGRAFSATVPKGAVIRTMPGAGTYASGTKVKLLVSSGPKPKKKKHRAHG